MMLMIHEKSISATKQKFTQLILSSHSKHYIKLSPPADLTSNNNITPEMLQQLNLGNWLLPDQPFPTPFKVVPIAELKSQPSLLHHSQGVPRFCVVPDTAALAQLQLPKTPTTIAPKQPQKLQLKPKPTVDKQQQQLQQPPPPSQLSPKTEKVLNSGKFRPLQPAPNAAARNVETKLVSSLLVKKVHRPKNKLRKRKLKKGGKYKCSHCPKRFSSLDYCKLHIAKHENKPSFFCRICEQGFLIKYVMKKHMDSDHQGQERCQMCNTILPSLVELSKHMKTPSDAKVCSECPESFDTCSSLDLHMRRAHGFVICTLCSCQVAKSMIQRHLVLQHSIAKDRSETGLEKLSYAPGEKDEAVEYDSVEVKQEVKTTPSPEVKKKAVEVGDCLARGRSVRRRSSKSESFACQVCERRFENERQYEIHLANQPMKFTQCPGCGRKFHRKSEFTEHSKTCNWNTAIPGKRERF